MRTTYKYDAKTGLMVPSAPQPAGTCNMLMVNQLAGFGAGGGGAPYVANAVEAGSGVYLKKASDLSGNANTKRITCSYWFRVRSSLSTDWVVYSANGFPLRTGITSTKIRIVGKDAADNFVVQLQTTTDYADGNWHHFATSFDLSDTNKRHLRIDDVSDIDVAVYTNAEIDCTQSQHTVFIGSDESSDDYLDELADFALFIGTYTDLSADNPFIDADGKPTDPGSDGSGYGLGTPIVMLKGPTTDWHTNKGSGGGFTENGALTTASTSPSD